MLSLLRTEGELWFHNVHGMAQVLLYQNASPGQSLCVVFAMMST